MPTKEKMPLDDNLEKEGQRMAEIDMEGSATTPSESPKSPDNSQAFEEADKDKLAELREKITNMGKNSEEEKIEDPELLELANELYAPEMSEKDRDRFVEKAKKIAERRGISLNDLLDNITKPE